MDDGAGLLGVALHPEVVASETDDRDLQTRFPKVAIFHDLPPVLEATLKHNSVACRENNSTVHQTRIE
jgi:hypothetical protein